MEADIEGLRRTSDATMHRTLGRIEIERWMDEIKKEERRDWEWEGEREGGGQKKGERRREVRGREGER